MKRYVTPLLSIGKRTTRNPVGRIESGKEAVVASATEAYEVLLDLGLSEDEADEQMRVANLS